VFASGAFWLSDFQIRNVQPVLLKVKFGKLFVISDWHSWKPDPIEPWMKVFSLPVTLMLHWDTANDDNDGNTIRNDQMSAACQALW
jgi:hypothetical protein